MPSTRLVLFAVTITLLTIIGCFNCFYTARASSVTSGPPQTTPQVIGGRWQLVRSSVDLEPLPATILVPMSAVTPPTHMSHRIDFRRHKRSSPPPSPLRFAPDALRERRVSLKEIVVSFRRIAHEDAKADAARSETKKGHSRLGRNSGRKGHPATSH